MIISAHLWYLCRRPAGSAVVPLSDNEITSGYYSPTTIRSSRPNYTPISGNDYYSNRPTGYSSAGSQSPDSYRRPQATYYRGPIAAADYHHRSPTRILEAPYDSSTGGSSVKASYQSPISRSDSADFPPYDGVHDTANGFQYYLRRHYHEEERGADGNVGSFGYIDPFGIRRVIYYKTDPFTGGFLHKKNNRYVGFNATPYDPLPPDLSRTRASRASSQMTS